jgi:hypothetical protein
VPVVAGVVEVPQAATARLPTITAPSATFDPSERIAEMRSSMIPPQKPSTQIFVPLRTSATVPGCIQFVTCPY